MRIQPIEPEQANDIVRRVYAGLEQRFGKVSPFYKMLAHKPEVLRAFNQLYSAIWTEGALPVKLKELAHLRVSILNGCAY